MDHLNCIVNQKYPHKILNQEQKQFKCPLHFCLTCYNEHLEDSIQRTVKKKLLRLVLKKIKRKILKFNY